ncbi:MAG TPA: SDR family NAD(P)-dependent oxidoreductase [Chthonomonadaceae bacterium]|nr:SDR family NAD(P)-dependent oxidoreductase [Chthonomonadaceae bacterium]
MQIDLSGKTAIVTGAGRGIGREIALTFAREGVFVVAADKDPDGLETLGAELEAAGRSGATFLCDVRSAARVAELAAFADLTCGRIDILVNNAGVSVTGTIDRQTPEGWSANIDTNLTGTFLVCHAVIPYMKRQRSGRILNAASFAAIVPSVGSAAYAASKAGVVSFTRVLAGELGPWNITANAYAPGMVPTQMNHFTEAPSATQERLLNTLTLRRWGEKQDVANLLCFLASDLASYITGSLVDVSGGKLATQIPQSAYERAAAE